MLSIRSFPKAILHMDGDAFFVGCEMAEHPELRGKAVVTGGERGIVTALSYEAKALGVTRGLPIFQLKKLFPSVIIRPGDYQTYALYSQKMFDVVRRYSDDVEEYSIDECFADLTGMRSLLKMTYEEILEHIKSDIKRELKITVSLGLAPNKVLAKIASKWQKPDGLTMIPGNKIHEFLPKISVGSLWGVGPSSSHFLQKKGVNNAYEFATKDESWVSHNLSKPFVSMWKELNGHHVHQIDPKMKDTYSSISRTRTFYPATSEEAFLISQISKHLEDVCSKARRFDLTAKKVSVFLKTKEFRYHSCEIKIPGAASVPEIIMPMILREFAQMHKKGTLYRTAGVTLHELVSSSVSQLDLFGESKQTDKFNAIHKQIDVLEAKFGKGVVHLGSTDNALKRVTLGTEFEDPNRDLLFL